MNCGEIRSLRDGFQRVLLWREKSYGRFGDGGLRINFVK
jgi:hypothetical protein